MLINIIWLDYKLTMYNKVQVIASKNPVHINVDNNIKGLRLTLAMRSGPKNDVAKFRQPAPKLAKVAFSSERPAF